MTDSIEAANSLKETVRSLRAAIEKNHEEQYRLTMRRQQLIEEERTINEALSELNHEEVMGEVRASPKDKASPGMGEKILALMTRDPNKGWTVAELTAELGGNRGLVNAVVKHSPSFVLVGKRLEHEHLTSRKSNVWGIKGSNTTE